MAYSKLSRQIGRCAPDLKVDYFFSSVFGGITGAGAGAMSPPFAGATAAGAVVGLVSGGVSSVQPATNAVANVRLESIAEALIPNLTFTGALLE